MHCTNDIRKVVKSHGDTITSYAGYSKRNFKKCHSTPLGRFSVKFFLSRITISERRRLGSWPFNAYERLRLRRGASRVEPAGTQRTRKTTTELPRAAAPFQE